MKSIKFIVGVTGGFALILATLIFAREYVFIVLFGIIVAGLLVENARLHKILRELGHPQDFKSRAEAIAKAKETAKAESK
jgi:hypothetical protein